MFASRGISRLSGLSIPLILAFFIGESLASLGDRLPDFKECVKVIHYPGFVPREKD